MWWRPACWIIHTAKTTCALPPPSNSGGTASATLQPHPTRRHLLGMRALQCCTHPTVSGIGPQSELLKTLSVCSGPMLKMPGGIVPFKVLLCIWNDESRLALPMPSGMVPVRLQPGAGCTGRVQSGCAACYLVLDRPSWTVRGGGESQMSAAACRMPQVISAVQGWLARASPGRSLLQGGEKKRSVKQGGGAATGCHAALQGSTQSNPDACLTHTQALVAKMHARTKRMRVKCTRSPCHVRTRCWSHQTAPAR